MQYSGAMEPTVANDKMEHSNSGSSQDGDNKAHEAPSQSPETTPGKTAEKKPSKIKAMW